MVVPFLETCYYLTQQAEQIKQERKSTQLIIPEALDSTETIEWKAFAAILDFICPLFGSGLVPLEILPSAAGSNITDLIHCVYQGPGCY
uniref:Uncharacterized protein n=1 Tax=Salix viminalis TaxID=40686 RepID=A0A6N2KRE2_SALVM